MTREVLELIAIASGVWATLTAGAWWLIHPRFQQSVISVLSEKTAEFSQIVLQALQANEGAYRKWNDALYVDWRREQVSAQTLGEKTHAAVEQIKHDFDLHREELREHRERMERALSDLSHLPTAIQNLAKAIERTTDVTTALARDIHNTQMEVAGLKGRQEATRSSTRRKGTP